ncbi:MAG: hypothetical protein IKT73_01090 [Anaerotignum sp.]|nr:hypothetical protein [Anaerotignum sp.]
MRYIENQNGIRNSQSLREHTHIIRKSGRSGIQQYTVSGCGKTKHTDFEPLHYADN